VIPAGSTLIPVAAVATAVTIILYLWAEVRRQRAPGAGREADPRLLRGARFAWHVQLFCVEVAAALLLNLILTHRFDLDYIYSHSSTNLPWVYLVSTFWSGQEGTFLLWAFYNGVIGCLLMRRLRNWEPAVLAVFSFVQLLVLGLLLARSPFTRLDLGHFSAADSQTLMTYFGGCPPEGQGLNKLLQNPWMAIHPPILFLGFATMAVPFCFACAGLWRRDPEGWAPRAQGWVLLAWSILGLGLILGGYWAYETLGWGGYWGWDPVENSSLAPWLLAGALFHGLLRQRATGGLQRRLNLALAGLAFGAVVYGSYLNRSGVLSDFSVHSFVALSPAFNKALSLFAGLPVALFLLLFAWRGGFGEAAGARDGAVALSRKHLLAWTTQLLLASGLVVLIGNSWPLLSGLAAKMPLLRTWITKPSSLQPSFFNYTHTPLAFVLLALLCVALLCDWDDYRRDKLFAGWAGPGFLTLPAAGVVIGALAVYLRGRAATPEVMPATAGKLALVWGALMVLSFFSAAVNLRILYAELRRGQRLSLGTHLAHGGFSLLILGIVASSVYQTKKMLPLAQDEPQSFGGYQVAYEGLNDLGEDAEMKLSVTAGDVSIALRPRLRPSQDGIIRNPAILKRLTHDLYLEPGEIKEGHRAGEVLLDMQSPATVGDLTIKFERFDLGQHQMDDPRNFRVGAVLSVTLKGQAPVEIEPAFAVKDGQPAPEAADLPGGGRVRFVNLPAAGEGQPRQLLLQIDKPGLQSTPETAIMQLTIKPLMSVVWLGCWLMIGGGLLAAARRLRAAGS
jgi:cytochrome c-type biogenesis protein CcmF